MPRLVHIFTVPESLGFLRGQIAYMKQHGFEISVIASPGEQLGQFGREQDVPATAIEMPRRIAPLRDLRALFQLARVLRERRPAIVHAHTPKGGLLGSLAGVLAGVPIRVYHMRGMPLSTATGARRALLKWSERIACLAATEVLCVSTSLRELALEERLCAADKIKVLRSGSGNGVDCDQRFCPAIVGARARNEVRQRYGIPDDAIVIGFLGRLARDKGARELLAAWRLLAPEYPNLHLLVAGELDVRDGISDEALGALSSDPRIHWKGADWNAPPLYAAIDIVTLPTYREGFPNVPLEAAAMERPVVATAVTGCVDAVEDGVTGLLVPPRDASALAAALRRYVDSPQLRARHGAAGRARVERLFRRELIWEALLTEYRALMELAP